MIIVLANGCFDILHVGHVEHLQQAKKMGDILIVALTADENVNKGPGRPVNKWHDRMTVLRELRCVDVVIKSRSSMDALHLIKPNIFVKGIDYADGKHFTEDVAGTCEDLGVELRFTSTMKRSANDIIRKALT